MKLHFGVLLCLCALAASLTPLKDHSEHGLFDIPIQIKNDYEDTMDTDEHTIRSRVVSRRSHCLSYADCNGGWCHKGQCLDGACDGDKLCPDGYGYECDGKNCFKYRPPWVQEIPGKDATKGGSCESPKDCPDWGWCFRNSCYEQSCKGNRDCPAWYACHKKRCTKWPRS